MRVAAVAALVGLLAGASLLPGAAAAPPAPPPALPAWDLAPSPNEGFATSRLSAVDCPSAHECWAVGNGWPGLESVPAMARWTGGAWQPVEAPAPARRLVVLYDVACPDAATCFAVGSVSNPSEALAGLAPLVTQAAIYRWDGQAWSLQQPEFPYAGPGGTQQGFAVLRSVSCASAADCWAVGHLRQQAAQNLFLHWDGASWTRLATPHLDDAPLALASIDCVSPSACMAVGPMRDSYIVPAPRPAVAVRWDGQAWSATPAPAPHLASAADASGVAAVQQWLGGVSCPAAGDCWAVGEAVVAGPASATVPVVQHWDGSAWTASVLAPPAPAVPAAAAALDARLAGVDCVSATDCWAVGHLGSDSTVPGAAPQDFTLRYDGQAWLPGPGLPDPAATFGGSLAGVACPAQDLCWAAGQVRPAGQVRHWMQGWDGAAWTAVPAPEPAARVGNYLNDVDCPAPSDCWAVGSYFHGQLGRTLVLRGDGSSWAAVPAPDSAMDRYDWLAGVSCSAPDDCWAVGSSSTWDGQDVQPLALHWDGAGWALGAILPDALGRALQLANGNGVAYAKAEGGLRAVHCNAPDDCWAVGFVQAAAGQAGSFLVGATLYPKPLLLHWDGQAWTPLPGPATATEPMTEHVLLGVSCASATRCYAVGSQFARLQYNLLAGPDARTLVMAWDGAAWSVLRSANPGEYANHLFGVSCAGASCWAVGHAYLDYPYSGTPRMAPVALRSTAGGAWVASPLPASAGLLDDVECLGEGDCWAVGSPPGLTPATATTALHWDGQAWRRAASASAQPGGAPAPNALVGLSCSGTQCWAVGHATHGLEAQTLVLRVDDAGGCVGGAACTPAGVLAEACLPKASLAPRPADQDGDGVPALYWAGRGPAVAVGPDGASAGAWQGRCGPLGDADDAGPTPATDELAYAKACVQAAKRLAGTARWAGC